MNDETNGQVVKCSREFVPRVSTHQVSFKRFPAQQYARESIGVHRYCTVKTCERRKSTKLSWLPQEVLAEKRKPASPSSRNDRCRIVFIRIVVWLGWLLITGGSMVFAYYLNKSLISDITVSTPGASSTWVVFSKDDSNFPLWAVLFNKLIVDQNFLIFFKVEVLVNGSL